MRFIHLSDLHIGKRVHEFSMLRDQEHILNQVLAIIDDNQVNGVIIAGDVYDKTIPSSEAVQLFDDFLYKLATRQLKVFIISGNHDSVERLSFGNRIMEHSGVHIAPIYKGNATLVELEDEYGRLNIYLLPFIKPYNVRPYVDKEINSYQEAVEAAIAQMNINIDERNVLVAHQFVTGAQRCESEEISVGGVDNIDSEVFKDFDYVALGHIHGPQNVGSDRIRYCGTLLKYSFSEMNHKKSVTIVDINEKGNVVVDIKDIKPLYDMKKLRGTFEELSSNDYYKDINVNDYMMIQLTDEELVINAIERLRKIYPNIMTLEYDNTRTSKTNVLEEIKDVEKKGPIDLFEEFYFIMNNKNISKEQREYLETLIDKISGGVIE